MINSQTQIDQALWQSKDQSALIPKGNAQNRMEKAKAFEAMALQQLLMPLFETIQTDGPFGGGNGESTMRSFHVEAIAKTMTERGGIGIAAQIQAQILAMENQYPKENA